MKYDKIPNEYAQQDWSEQPPKGSRYDFLAGWIMGAMFSAVVMLGFLVATR